MNKDKLINKIDIILLYVIIIELILGGAGRVITIGPLTIRYLIFGFSMIYFCVKVLLKEELVYKKYTKFLIYFGILCFSLAYGLITYEFSHVIEHFKGNLFLLMFFPLSILIKKKGTVFTVIKLIINCSVILSIITIFIFLFVTIFPAAFNDINDFLHYIEYGHLAKITDGITRVFFKTSPFTACSAVLVLAKILSFKNVKLKDICIFIVLGIGCMLSFTMGIWLAFFIGCIFVFVYREKTATFILPKKKYLVLGFSVIVILCIVCLPTLIEIVYLRSLGENSSLVIKWEQSLYMLDEWMNSIFIGNGFGITRTFIFEDSERVMRIIEMFWLDLLSTTGLIGVAAAIYFMGCPVYDAISFLKREEKSKRKKVKKYYVQILGLAATIITMCVCSTFNPFLNNPIGIMMVIIGVLSIPILLNEE